LDFSGCGNIKNIAVENMIEGLESLTSLQTLYLDFSNCIHLSGTAGVKMSQFFEKLTSLKELTYNIANTNYDDHGLFCLGKSLQKIDCFITKNFVECSELFWLKL